MSGGIASRKRVRVLRTQSLTHQQQDLDLARSTRHERSHRRLDRLQRDGVGTAFRHFGNAILFRNALDRARRVLGLWRRQRAGLQARPSTPSDPKSTAKAIVILGPEMTPNMGVVAGLGPCWMPASCFDGGKGAQARQVSSQCFAQKYLTTAAQT